MQKQSSAFITSLGIISAIGDNVLENLDALLERKSGIGPAKYLQTIHQFPVGEVKHDNQSLAEMADVLSTLPRTSLLSIIAAKEAWKPFKISSKGYKIGLISANTVGGMDLTENEYHKLDAGEPFEVRKIWNHECGSITELTQDALGLEDCWTSTLSTACSSSANTIMLGAKLIEQGKLDIVIAGGADSLSKFTLNGFNSLMILDKELCQPFDAERRGLNLGEAAAYVVLMSEAAIRGTGATKLAVVSGYANANDAHHQTASSPEGLGNQEAMKRALDQAELKPESIDYINLHGTGTANNDSSEGIAIEKVFGEGSVPLASSTKCYTGHTLGAAGAVEAVFSVLALQKQKAWANRKIETAMPEFKWSVLETVVEKELTNIMSNSFGFGGNCSALIISKPERI